MLDSWLGIVIVFVLVLIGISLEMLRKGIW